MIDDIEEFGEEMESIKTDTIKQTAHVREVEAVVKHQAYEKVEHNDDDGQVAGLNFVFESLGGQTTDVWVPMPDEWVTRSNLVCLFEYWGLEPDQVTTIQSTPDEFEVPIRLASYSDDPFELDWRSISVAVTEEGDDIA